MDVNQVCFKMLRRLNFQKIPLFCVCQDLSVCSVQQSFPQERDMNMQSLQSQSKK